MKYLVENQLYYNNGDLIFTDEVHARNATDSKISMGAVFFDYDIDGDPKEILKKYFLFIY